MKRLLIILAALLLTACSGFKLGAVCYLPADHLGECKVMPRINVQVDSPAPAASGVSV